MHRKLAKLLRPLLDAVLFDQVGMKYPDDQPLVLRHRTDEFATHQPILIAAIGRSEGPVLELGCGAGSTPLLNRICAQRGRQVVTIESSPVFFRRYAKRFAGPNHRFIFAYDWVEQLKEQRGTNWGTVFVDQSPWASRVNAVRMLKRNAGFVVIHDCDYFPAHGLFGISHEPIEGASAPGRRTYDDTFAY